MSGGFILKVTLHSIPIRVISKSFPASYNGCDINAVTHSNYMFNSMFLLHRQEALCVISRWDFCFEHCCRGSGFWTVSGGRAPSSGHRCHLQADNVSQWCVDCISEVGAWEIPVLIYYKRHVNKNTLSKFRLFFSTTTWHPEQFKKNTYKHFPGNLILLLELIFLMTGNDKTRQAFLLKNISVWLLVSQEWQFHLLFLNIHEL